MDRRIQWAPLGLALVLAGCASAPSVACHDVDAGDWTLVADSTDPSASCPYRGEPSCYGILATIENGGSQPLSTAKEHWTVLDDMNRTYHATDVQGLSQIGPACRGSVTVTYMVAGPEGAHPRLHYNGTVQMDAPIRPKTESQSPS